MKYVLGYEICALIFLIVLMWRFFEMRRFPNEQNTLFCIIMWCALSDLVFNIFGSVLMDNPAAVPVWVNYLVNSIFYSLQTLFPALMMAYVLLMTRKHRYKRFFIIPLFIPLLFFEAFLLTNLFTRLVFYVDYINGVLTYVHTPLFPCLYIIGASYMAAILIYINIYRRKLSSGQYTTITAIIAVSVAATAVQFACPQVLLTGVAIVIAIMLIYFTFQNPDDLLDFMTGAFNYRALLTFLDNATSERDEFYLIAADIGGMRRINSLFGMEFGNKILISAAQVFLSCGNHTWVFRMLGTRFILITHSVKEYLDMLEQISNRFQEPFPVDGVDVVLSATVRHFYSGGRFSSAEGVISVIDTLYSGLAKSEKGTIAAINETLLVSIRRRLVLEAALRAAIETGAGFEIVFQPLYSLKNGCFPSVEVLLRFSCDALGRVPPSEFIPIVENIGLITRVDELVVRKVCKFINRYDPAMFGLSSICLNLSAAEFFIPNTPERFKKIVDEYGVDHSLILFEITETVASAPYDVYSSYMQIMREDGFRFALDDFGTGYSNAAQIANLPFSAIKLDKSLLFSNRRSGPSFLVFEAVLRLAKHLGLLTFVEGVETPFDAEYACRLGADYIQGFYYSLPLSENDLIDFLKANNY
ncbi:MAG: EAL domain-containing protein [Oscillospiraceae bacterium]